MSLRCLVSIDAGDAKSAARLCQALLPEVASNKSRAATISVENRGSRIVISITSSTIAAGRALLNSYIRWISISLDIISMKSENYG